MKRCTTVIEWLTYADGDFQCKENYNKSAVRQSLKGFSSFYLGVCYTKAAVAYFLSNRTCQLISPAHTLLELGRTLCDC